MSLTERERFIHHFITLSTLRIIGSRYNKEGEQLEDSEKMSITAEEQNDIKVILSTRCRNLTNEDVKEIFEDLSEEALLGGSVINDLMKWFI